MTFTFSRSARRGALIGLLLAGAAGGAFAQTKAGKTPAEIRLGIARHEYEAIDLEKE